MTALLQSGFKNNINIIAIRGNARSHVYTDRAIDYDGNGVKEAVSSVGVPNGTGINVQQTVTTPTGAARTIVEGSAAEPVNFPTGDTDYTLSNN
jgi:hypothetical protein